MHTHIAFILWPMNPDDVAIWVFVAMAYFTTLSPAIVLWATRRVAR